MGFTVSVQFAVSFARLFPRNLIILIITGPKIYAGKQQRNRTKYAALWYGYLLFCNDKYLEINYSYVTGTSETSNSVDLIYRGIIYATDCLRLLHISYKVPQYWLCSTLPAPTDQISVIWSQQSNLRESNTDALCKQPSCPVCSNEAMASWELRTIFSVISITCNFSFLNSFVTWWFIQHDDKCDRR